MKYGRRTILLQILMQIFRIIVTPGSYSFYTLVQLPLETQDMILKLQEDKYVHFRESTENKLPACSNLAGSLQELRSCVIRPYTGSDVFICRNNVFCPLNMRYDGRNARFDVMVRHNA